MELLIIFMNIKPVLKWVGGKRQLLPEIKKYIPESFNTYIEPFIGGGAVLFEIQPKKAIINDINNELTNVYNVIKTNPTQLIEILKSYKNDEITYYTIRNLDRDNTYDKINDIDKAARTIYLNRTCFNGLYRVNSKGQNNVPYGKYKNPTICDKDNINNLSIFLNNNSIEIKNTDFINILNLANENDFVYLDPPYDPLTNTSSFVSYNKNGFDKEDQRRLKESCDNLTKRKVKFLLSNSSTEFIKELYKDYQIIEIDAKRNISATTKGRKNVKEVLIKNY